MKKPTQDLIAEHALIVIMLEVMRKVAERLRKGEEVRQEHLTKMVDFLRNFVDKCHHGKEEAVLFPEMLKNPANAKLINELLGEHQTGRDFIRGIADSAGKYRPGSPDAIHIAVNAEDYVSLIIEHIKKENQILFPIADKELSEQEQEQIEERFEKLEREVIGEGKHEEYHGWLKELEKAYLGGGHLI